MSPVHATLERKLVLTVGSGTLERPPPAPTVSPLRFGKDQIDFKSQIKKLYARASSTILNGVSAARRTRENPAAFNIFESRPSPA